MRKQFLIFFSFSLVFFSCSLVAVSQPAWTFDLFGKEKKPEKYEEKLLPSEKTDKKYTVVRNFLQNTTSHYNFFYNANAKLDAIVERAKIANKDDYAKLLSFYGYSLENTASQKSDLDSVVYKCTAGILLHDLRSNWVDNFYLLIGKSYFFKKDFDSAALTFQFINYNLFPRKKRDDDDKIVGSNTATSGKGSVSIADKEDRDLFKKLTSRPPSRNEALLWQIRTFIEQNELSDAAGLISILQNDPNLPKRLQDDLEEVTSYWFYNQANYDSAAIHLEKALSNADSKVDKSRWQFLLAQLYEISGKYEKATAYYAKASKSTADVVMDIYAKLNSAKMLRQTTNSKELDNSIANLLQMAKKDRYEDFRDLLYYSAAQLYIQKTDTAAGVALYKKSTTKAKTGSAYKDKSFLQLGNIAYAQFKYKDAQNYYDSVTVIKKEGNTDSATVAERKEVLGRLIPKVLAIEKEDSIQKIAQMPEAERTAFVKKLAKKYRKENGLKEEQEETNSNEPITFANKNNEPVNIFGSNGAGDGQWYFYNANQKTKGFNDFKTKWGKRANVDNWRRKASSTNALSQTTGIKGAGGNANPDTPATIAEKEKEPAKAADFSYEGLMAGLPLTKESLDTSNNIIATNLLDAAQIFQNELQDYEQALSKYNDFVNRFPTNKLISEVYFGMSFCYSKLGNESKANLYKNLIRTNFASSDAAKKMQNPTGFLKPNSKSPEATAQYEAIYNLFIEGKFEEAVAVKKKADSTYNNTYWNPQLLYIEAVYFIKERKDSLAIIDLNNIVSLYPKSPLKNKATTMIDVLGRRADIEKYLTELQVTRVADEQIIIADDKPIIKVAAPTVKPVIPIANAPVGVNKRVIADSIKKPEIYVNKAFTLQPDKPHFVAMILDKVDGVYVSEAKNALERFNKESMATIDVVIKKDTISTDKALLLFSKFENATDAMKYFDKVKRAAPSELSWLQASKYSFIIISDDNLQLLKTNKDLTAYKDLLIKNFGNKF